MILFINITQDQKEALLTQSPSIREWVNRAIKKATEKILNENLFITDEDLKEYSDRLALNGCGPNRKRIVTQATRDRISKTLKEKYKDGHYPLFEETKKKIGLIHKGKIVSQATRDKVSKANTGKKRTEEQKKRIGLGHKGLKYKRKGKS
ncbi:hypothetical protein ES704_03559 [subsurface metagenome]|jgi:hypothetical protein